MEKEMKRPIFNPEITWGHIMQLAGVLAVALVLYGDARVYKERTDARITRLEERDTDNRKRMDQTDVTIRNLSEAVVKLTTMVDVGRAN